MTWFTAIQIASNIWMIMIKTVYGGDAMPDYESLILYRQEQWDECGYCEHVDWCMEHDSQCYYDKYNDCEVSSW